MICSEIFVEQRIQIRRVPHKPFFLEICLIFFTGGKSGRMKITSNLEPTPCFCFAWPTHMKNWKIGICNRLGWSPKIHRCHLISQVFQDKQLGPTCRHKWCRRSSPTNVTTPFGPNKYNMWISETMLEWYSVIVDERIIICMDNQKRYFYASNRVSARLRFVVCAPRF